MNDELSEFEKQLRRMSPVSCDYLKDDAMYRAGWNAAQAVMALRCQSASPKTKSSATFAKGILCGVLLFGAGLAAAQLRGVEQLRPQDSVVELNVAVPTVDVGVKSVALTEDSAAGAADAVHPELTLSSFSALLMPWLNSLDEGSVDVTPSAAKPLSIAARHQWSQMVVSDSTVLVTHQGSKESAADDDQKFPCLRTRPLSDLNMKDLL